MLTRRNLLGSLLAAPLAWMLPKVKEPIATWQGSERRRLDIPGDFCTGMTCVRDRSEPLLWLVTLYFTRQKENGSEDYKLPFSTRILNVGDLFNVVHKRQQGITLWV